MKLIQYVGSRASKADNVAGTGLVWAQEQVHAVSDEVATKLLGYPSVWREVPEVPVVSEPVPEAKKGGSSPRVREFRRIAA